MDDLPHARRKGSSPAPEHRRLGDMSITIGFKALSLKMVEVSSFEGLGLQLELEYMYLQRNWLRDFQFLGCQPNLREIHVQRNRIKSLAGLVKQPKCEFVGVANNPIAEWKHHRIMLLAVIGPSLKKIDELPVSYAERCIAKQLPDIACYAVSCGWRLDLKKRSYSEYAQLAQESREALGLAQSQPPLPEPQQRRTASHSTHSGYTQSVQRTPMMDASVPRSQRTESMSPAYFGNLRGEDGGTPSPSPRRGANISHQSNISHISHASSADQPPSPAPSTPRSPEGVLTVAGIMKPEEDAKQQVAMRQTYQGNNTQQLRIMLQEAKAELMKERLRNTHLMQGEVQREMAGSAPHPVGQREEDATTAHIMVEEFPEISEVAFGKGIRVDSTIEKMSRVASAFVTLDPTHISFAHFFNRTRLCEIAYSAINEVKLDLPNQIIFFRCRPEALTRAAVPTEQPHEEMVEITLESRAKLITLYKCIYFRLGRLPDAAVVASMEDGVARKAILPAEVTLDPPADSSSESAKPFTLGTNEEDAPAKVTRRTVQAAPSYTSGRNVAPPPPKPEKEKQERQDLPVKRTVPSLQSESPPAEERDSAAEAFRSIAKEAAAKAGAKLDGSRSEVSVGGGGGGSVAEAAPSTKRTWRDSSEAYSAPQGASSPVIAETPLSPLEAASPAGNTSTEDVSHEAKKEETAAEPAEPESEEELGMHMGERGEKEGVATGPV